MTKKPKSPKGLPKAMQAEIDEGEAQHEREESLKEFVENMHGEGSVDKPQTGLPSREWLQEQFQTKSAIIRYLINQGHTVNEIVKHLGLRYQHVRNVANSPLKRGPNEDWRKPLIEGTSIPDLKRFKPEED